MEEFRKRFNVSRETMERLRLYEELITKWNPAINLVSASTLPAIWYRHFTESAQAYFLVEPTAGHWVDLGSGGGFPGAVAAILAAEFSPQISVTCIDSDRRKCEFLRTLSRSLEIPIMIHARRIEDLPPQNARIASARAVAPLPRLLDLVHRHLASNGTAILHKGAGAPAEIRAALEIWRFRIEKHQSLSCPESVILRIGELAIA